MIDESFLVRRVLQSLLLLLVVITAIFFLVHLTPGGPEAALANNPRTSPDEIQRLRERFGLDRPAAHPVRALADQRRAPGLRPLVLLRAAGHRDRCRAPGPDHPAGRDELPRGPAGRAAGRPRGAEPRAHGDSVIRLVTTLGHALPTWWFGLTIIVVLNSLIGWFPNGQGSGGPWQWFIYIIFPALVLGLAALVTFHALRALGGAGSPGPGLRADRARQGTARTAGHRRHVLRNALLPVVTQLGYVLPFVLSGALITEYVFAWPGIGRLFYEAAVARDYPILLAILTMTTFATILGTLLADVAYGIVDPRVRYA